MECVRSAGKWVLFALIFSASYTQAFLYAANQHDKFLHGLAMAGEGLLNEDWTARTTDPLPAFGFLVYLTSAFLHKYFFYAYYVVLFGIYIYSLMGTAAIVFDLKKSKLNYLAVFTVVLLYHSRLARVKILERGVAGQYLLGPEFQNSVFGVLLILSIYLFLRRYFVWSVISLVFAAIMHSAYLFHAGLLTISYMIVSLRETKSVKKPVQLGLLALALVSPVLWYNMAYLDFTSKEIFQKSMYIMTHIRIPHHSLPSVWLDASEYLKVGVMIAGLYLVRKSVLFIVLLIPFLAGAVLTVAQLLTGSDAIAYFAPWRVSVFLVPVSGCIIAASIVSMPFKRYQLESNENAKKISRLCVAIIALLVISGTAYQIRDYVRLSSDKTLPLMNFVRETKASGQIYLIPPRTDRFMGFRLYTGAPILIHWKSEPYKDVELLQWYDRVLIAQRFYAAEGHEACAILQKIVDDYGVTHVIMDSARVMRDCSMLKEIFTENGLSLLRIDLRKNVSG
ncbi:MAG: hypothetical protein HZC49_11775 [Nitrospirae bacterium]|nr:hypothetical protein [Nitrospirota bacterium]